MQFSIPVDTIKALLLAAAKGDIRYYLNAVCLDVAPDGTAVAVATDGHIMLARGYQGISAIAENPPIKKVDRLVLVCLITLLSLGQGIYLF